MSNSPAGRPAFPGPVPYPAAARVNAVQQLAPHWLVPFESAMGSTSQSPADLIAQISQLDQQRLLSILQSGLLPVMPQFASGTGTLPGQAAELAASGVSALGNVFGAGFGGNLAGQGTLPAALHGLNGLLMQQPAQVPGAAASAQQKGAAAPANARAAKPVAGLARHENGFGGQTRTGGQARTADSGVDQLAKELLMRMGQDVTQKPNIHQPNVHQPSVAQGTSALTLAASVPQVGDGSTTRASTLMNTVQPWRTEAVQNRQLYSRPTEGQGQGAAPVPSSPVPAAPTISSSPVPAAQAGSPSGNTAGASGDGEDDKHDNNKGKVRDHKYYREAARKSRLKKKAYIQELEETRARLQMMNEKLQEEQVVREQLQQLVRLLGDHHKATAPQVAGNGCQSPSLLPQSSQPSQSTKQARVKHGQNSDQRHDERREDDDVNHGGMQSLSGLVPNFPRDSVEPNNSQLGCVDQRNALSAGGLHAVDVLQPFASTQDLMDSVNGAYASMLATWVQTAKDASAALKSGRGESELASLCRQFVETYRIWTESKAQAVRSNVYTMLTEFWRLPGEKRFPWLADFQPSAALFVFANKWGEGILTEEDRTRILRLRERYRMVEEGMSEEELIVLEDHFNVNAMLNRLTALTELTKANLGKSRAEEARQEEPAQLKERRGDTADLDTESEEGDNLLERTTKRSQELLSGGFGPGEALGGEELGPVRKRRRMEDALGTESLGEEGTGHGALDRVDGGGDCGLSTRGLSDATMSSSFESSISRGEVAKGGLGGGKDGAERLGMWHHPRMAMLPVLPDHQNRALQMERLVSLVLHADNLRTAMFTELTSQLPCRTALQLWIRIVHVLAKSHELAKALQAASLQHHM